MRGGGCHGNESRPPGPKPGQGAPGGRCPVSRAEGTPGPAGVVLRDVVLDERWCAALQAVGGVAGALPRARRLLGRGHVEAPVDLRWPALLQRLYGVTPAAPWHPAALGWCRDRHELLAGGPTLARLAGGAAAATVATVATVAAAASVVPGAALWRADPVHLVPAIDHLRLALGSSRLALTATETRAIVDALNAHFAEAGIAFAAASPQRWYAWLPGVPAVASTAPQVAEGGDVRAHLPAGQGGARLLAVANEVQMLLAAHPVNVERERRGLPAANSVWLWGGPDGDLAGDAGRLAASARGAQADLAARLPVLFSRDAVLAGFWEAAGAGERVHDPDRLLGARAAGADHGGDVLLVLDDAVFPAAGDAAMAAARFEALLGALAGAARGRTTLRLAGADRLITAGAAVAGGRAFWRRPLPLARLLGG